MTTDKLGNVYVVGEGNQVIKYNSLGIAESNFSNKYLGTLKWVDATNPLKVLLFYPDFNHVTTLDNKLSLRTEVPLRDLNILQPVLICASVNEGFWIFDQQDFQLKRLSLDLKIIQESGNITQLTGVELHPTQLIESNGYVYLNNPGTGVLVFDLFGTYYKTIPIKNIVSMQVQGDDLFYFRDGKLTAFHIKSLQEKEVELPYKSDSLIINIRVEEQKIYVLKKEQVNIYKRF